MVRGEGGLTWILPLHAIREESALRGGEVDEAVGVVGGAVGVQVVPSPSGVCNDDVRGCEGDEVGEEEEEGGERGGGGEHAHAGHRCRSQREPAFRLIARPKEKPYRDAIKAAVQQVELSKILGSKSPQQIASNGD